MATGEHHASCRGCLQPLLVTTCLFKRGMFSIHVFVCVQVLQNDLRVVVFDGSLGA